MAAGGNWAALPSVIIVEILSYLSLRDRIKASSLCRRWRLCLFHPNLWSRLEYELAFPKREKSKFLSDRCGRFVRETIVRFNSHNLTEVRECARILKVLAGNKNTESFTLQPSSCHIEWPTTQPVHVIDRYLDSIESLIKTSRKLRHFALGCVEELLEHSNILVSLLARHHANHLESLHLASVKEDSDNYGIIELNADHFRPFRALRQISIDFDYLTNQLLETFVQNKKPTLEKMVIHVHGLEGDHEKIRNDSWRKLRNLCPKLEVTLNLIHSMDGVVSLLDILQPHMPLAHYRQFFCSDVNMAAINFMATHYGSTLKSIHIIDGLTFGQPNVYESDADEDAFVMLSWRCPKLEYFSLIGYEFSDNDVIAMARLRGKQLQTFHIPLSCIITVEEDSENLWVGHGCVDKDFSKQVSGSLCRDWRPLDDGELPLAVFNAQADAEKAYMKILLADQIWKSPWKLAENRQKQDRSGNYQ